MRFAWLRKKSSTSASTKSEPNPFLKLIMVAYNIIWWIPILLPIVRVIDYRTGFIAFLVITVVRVVVNLLRNNYLKPEQAEHFALRSP